jgi:hypothetical protein
MSEIKLNIYRRDPETKRRVIDRVVTAETAFIPFGPVQDIMEAIDVEAVIEMMSGKEVDKAAIVTALAPAIMGAMKEITPILLDTFQDVTEDEIRMCDTAEICRVIIDILAMAVGTMFAKAKKKTKQGMTVGV